MVQRNPLDKVETTPNQTRAEKSPLLKSSSRMTKNPDFSTVSSTHVRTYVSNNPQIASQKQNPAKSLARSSPNYTKPTSSSNSRNDLSQRNTNLSKSPKLGSDLSKREAKLKTRQRATCSSTLKDFKFPEYLMLDYGGTESHGAWIPKVCPYTYCSLNGHLHVPSLPLKSFAAFRRRVLKNQEGTKGHAAKNEDLFIEIFAVSKDEGDEVEESCDIITNIKEGESQCESAVYESEIENHILNLNNSEDDWYDRETDEQDELVEAKAENHGLNDEQDELAEAKAENHCDEALVDVDASYRLSKLKVNKRCKGSSSEEDELRKLNLRKPNFLPIYVEPEAEKVNLRHNAKDERKDVEEWMIDFALQKTVTKLGQTQNRNVGLLVKAFETIISVPKSETHIRQHRTDIFALVKQEQACN